MNDVRLKAINRCGAVLIAATLRTFRLPMSPCVVSKVHTGPLQDLRVLEIIFLVVLFEKYVLRLLFVAKIPPHQ